MKEGHLTVLVVPEDEHDVRQLRVSYRALRWLGAVGGVLGTVLLVVLLTYGGVASRATRAALLERENRRLAAENAKVGEIVENLERSERTYEQIRSLAGLEDLPTPAAVAAAVPAAERGEARGTVTEGPEPSGWPLAVRGFVTSRFEGADGHSGVDIAVPTDTPVLATAAGEVSAAGFDAILGHFVVLSHGGGFETMYGHNGRLLVEPGKAVERGEAVAYSGNSGRSTAPHLHYEVRQGGRPVDPEPYLR